VPLRLGEDVFAQQRITQEKAKNLEAVMLAFGLLIDAYGATDWIACATSAMREARNGREIVRAIKKRTGIEIEIIEGKREAAIIYSSHIGHAVPAASSLLYVDVGGGSTELTLLSRSRIMESSSFKIGTVRTLQKGRSKQDWDDMKAWLKAKVAPYHPLAAVGTGGSINNLFRLSRKKEGKPLTAKLIKEITEYVASYTIEERIKVLGLRPDRADVIIEASEIYLSVMKWAGIKKMFVPVMGLSDGLIHMLYEKVKSKDLDL
jgi:exopolyphosphatase / guanosine-5'-triphosphate,3'-diphosphate pyrophosphatase